MKDLIFETKNSVLMNYYQGNFYQNLVQRNIEKDIFLKKLINEEEIVFLEKKHKNLKKNNLLSIMKLQKIRSISGINNLENLFKKNKAEQKLTVNVDFYNKFINKVNYELKKSGIDLTVIYFPDFERYNNPQKVITFHKERIISFLKKNNIKVIDLDENMLKNLKDPKSLYPFRQRGHFNETGNEITATIISKFVDLSAYN